MPRADKQVRAGLCPRTAFLLRTSCTLAAQEEGVGFSSAQVSCFRLWVSGVGGTSQVGSQGSFAACSMLGCVFLAARNARQRPAVHARAALTDVGLHKLRNHREQRRARRTTLRVAASHAR